MKTSFTFAVNLVFVVAGCAGRRPEPEAPGVVPEEPLPELRVEQITEPPRPPAGPEQAAAPTVTLTATNTDVRLLLPTLAEAAGVSLVMGPAVSGRISVFLRDVPAAEALRIVLEEAGLGVGLPLRAPWGPVIFYDLPVNINGASARLIQERFGVIEELAEWIVASRRMKLQPLIRD